MPGGGALPGGQAPGENVRVFQGLIRSGLEGVSRLVHQTDVLLPEGPPGVFKPSPPGHFTSHPFSSKIDKKGKLQINSIELWMNGQTTEVMDVAPFLENNRTWVPVRFVLEALGLSRRD
ncbi:MAG: stalk domain-containing protein, partial [bacterium]